MLCLGGSWIRTELGGRSDEDLRSMGAQLGVQRSERSELVAALVGKERDPALHVRALAAFAVPQSMLSAAAARLSVAERANIVCLAS